MLVKIPGIAFGAIKDSGFETQYPGLWARIQDYSVTLAEGKGITVGIELCEDDWEALRACMILMIRKLSMVPYPVRGLEGTVIIHQLQIALDRVSAALMLMGCERYDRTVT